VRFALDVVIFGFSALGWMDGWSTYTPIYIDIYRNLQARFSCICIFTLILYSLSKAFNHLLNHVLILQTHYSSSS
jgi:hypothetical protein